MRRARALLALVLILSVLVPAQTGQAGASRQDDTARREAAALLARMTPEEKVGQLFLISFKGTDVSKGTQLSDLLTRNHIGGVVLRADNDNFTAPETTATDAHALVASLQQQVWDSYQDLADTPSHYAPLFVGISQEGDLYPNDQLFNGLTQLPDEMAVGATWNPSLSREVGAVLGSELSALGFNLLIGPSLDVQEDVPAEGSDDMGSRTFGGDPYWVGMMGQSYIQGLHEGSQGKLAVIAKHFPGRGSSDRPPEEEVATVRKSLEQLKQIELAPFFSVTGNATDALKTTDGLLVSHIRYQGFQNNIRATTSPVSFDRAALDMILKLPEFSTWRNNGGVMVSDDLGSAALKRFYETTGQTFDARQVARNAFLAGNDLLYLNNFTADPETDAYTTIVRTLSLFVAKYREDSAFAERVDASVTRLLTLKFHLYGAFNIKNVLSPAAGLDTVGTSQQVTFEVARQSATLLSPSVEDMETVLPRPPGVNDRIVFITDVRSARQCSRCMDQVAFAQDALQTAVLRLYGPQAGGQVYASRLSSYSFSDLQNMLNGVSEVSAVEQDLRQAGWIVFASLKLDRNRVESTALRRFLSERPDLFRNKRVIAFTFNAPYYLDATDISKLTAYYALYSKTAAFVDVAARILFQELTPAGASPVSVPGVGYNMITVTSPDPGQVIPLYLDTPELPASGPAPAVTPLPTPVPVFKVGDSLPLRTGTILDHNQNPVPDGTVVRFLFTVGGDTGTVQQIEAITTAGVARAAYRIQSSGLLEVRVVSDPAITSQLLRMDVSATGGVITPISPTIEPTITPTPTLTVTPTVTPTATPVPLAPSRPGSSDWLLAMALIWISAGSIFLVAQQRLSVRWGFRWALSAAVGGLLAYLYFALLRLFNEDETRGLLTDRILFVTLIGILLGLAVGVFWNRWLARRARSQPERPSTGPKSPIS